MTTIWSILERRSAPPATAVPPIAVTATSARRVSRDRVRRRPTMATSHPKGAFGIPRAGSLPPPCESTVDRAAPVDPGQAPEPGQLVGSALARRDLFRFSRTTQRTSGSLLVAQRSRRLKPPAGRAATATLQQ